MKTHSNRVTKKIADVLKLIGRGLIENKGLERDTLMTFIYGLASEAATDSADDKYAVVRICFLNLRMLKFFVIEC